MAKMPTALILAGGLGTRLKKMNINTPKALVEFNNMPFMEIQINWLIKHGINKIIVLAGYKYEYIERFIENYQNNNNCEINIIIEKQALGTGGALINALETDYVKDEFMLFNGDSLVDVNLLEFYKIMSIKGTFGMIAYKINSTNRYGSITFDKDNYMTSFSEKYSPKSKYIYINTGVYYFNNKSIIKNYTCEGPLSLEYDVIPYMLNDKQKFYIYTKTKNFIDIGTLESLNSFKKNISQWEKILQ